ncbi:hypothetical protein D0T50_00040 [Bacteroides sp. 214]|nr:hypothetical protein [Bacteroides sp. 214]
MTFSGGLGLQFGDYTLVSIDPQVGYNVTNFLNMGAGINYTYMSHDYDEHYKIKNTYLGINVYAKCFLFNYGVIMIQPEANRMWKTLKYDRGEKFKSEKLVPTCVIGAGIRLGAVTAMLKYDLAQDKNSPYGSKVFYSVGYTFSL